MTSSSAIGHVRRVFVGLLSLLMAVAGVVLLAPTRADAATLVDVTVRITRVVEIESADGDGTNGDFFPRIQIGGGATQSRPAVINPDKRDFNPDWRIKQQVDQDAGPFAIRIELWDEDDTAAFDHDHVDISPTNQDVNIDITFDPATRTWTSTDLPPNATHAVGDGDRNFPDTNDGTRTRIDFDIFVGGTPDFDADGIPDHVERFGVRDENNNVIATLGTSPCRKSIAVEIDWMRGAADGHSHQPKPDAIAEVVGAFGAGDVDPTTPCPFAGASTASGVDLKILPGNGIDESPVMGLKDDFRTARDANFNAALRPYVHYAIFVHDQKAGESSSGLCCESTQGSKDFIVSLGSWHTSPTCVGPGPNGTRETPTAGDDQVVGTSINHGADGTCETRSIGDDTQDETVGVGSADRQVGTAREQAATIMHELGHSIGLGHGGADDINFKPNYLSNENYRFQFGIPTGPAPAPSRLDYSRAALPTLNERDLKEADGIGDGTDFTAWVDPDGGVQWSIGNVAINWDQTATADQPVDLNADDTCVLPGADGKLDTSPASGDVLFNPDTAKTSDDEIREGSDGDCDTGPAGDDVDATILNGYDDWGNLSYRAVESSTAGGAHAHTHSHPDMTFAEKFAAEQQLFDYYEPDVKVTKAVDRSNAEGGETLNYTVDADNIGPGDARDVALVDTLPNGSVEKRAIGDLDAGNSTSRPFSYAVPCDTADGTVLTNSVKVTATDRSGRAEQNTTNNASSVSTTIHAPKLTLSKTATSSVNAGEAITYQVDYGNVGSATATGVVVTDTVPSGVYYSEALDLGGGPRPSSVVRNDDGTTTLTWAVGDVAADGSGIIEYTARPSLLFLGGETLTDKATATFGNSAGCVFAAVEASASSTITVVSPTRDPRSHGFWKTHPELRTEELRARTQATDQRYDGADGTTANGELSNTEAQAVLDRTGNQPAVLEYQLLAVYLDLADRRINAKTLIDSKLTRALGLTNVRDAVLYAQETLALGFGPATSARYDDATRVLDEIVTNRSPRY